MQLPAQTKDTNERLIWIDILNILCAFIVVLNHSSIAPSGAYDGPMNFNFFLCVIVESFFYFPVPVFLMLSGAKLMTYNKGWKQFYVRRFKKIGIPFIAWNFFYICIWIIYHGFNDMTWRELLRQSLAGTSILWFFEPLFVLYLCIPFLNVLLTNASENMLRWLVYFALIFGVTLPWIFDMLSIERVWEFPFGANLLIYGILGYLLAQTNVFKNHRLIYTLALLSGTILLISNIVCIQVIHTNMFVFSDYGGLPTCLLSAGAFLWFKNHDWSNFLSKTHLTPEILKTFSSYSFGIYLIHIFYLRLYVNFFHLGQPEGLLCFFVVYSLSVISIFILKKIPIVRNLVP